MVEFGSIIFKLTVSSAGELFPSNPDFSLFSSKYQTVDLHEPYSVNQSITKNYIFYDEVIEI